MVNTIREILLPTVPLQNLLQELQIGAQIRRPALETTQDAIQKRHPQELQTVLHQDLPHVPPVIIFLRDQDVPQTQAVLVPDDQVVEWEAAWAEADEEDKLEYPVKHYFI